MSRALAELQRELGGRDPLPASLTDADARKLLDSLRTAKARERAALKAAIDEGMSFVPALLRIPLRRILFP